MLQAAYFHNMCVRPTVLSPYLVKYISDIHINPFFGQEILYCEYPQLAVFAQKSRSTETQAVHHADIQKNLILSILAAVFVLTFG